MDARRRRLLEVLAAAALGPAALWPARATHGGGSERSLRLIVPQAAGGAADSTARLVGDALAPLLGHRVLVDNRPGGGTVAGTLAMAQAAPDGDTIGLVVSTLAINQAMRRHMPYDALADFAPVCLGGYSLLVLVADSELPAADVPQLLALAARSRPPLQFASLGVGSASHLAGELLRLHARVELEHVPFNGSTQIYQSLIGGQISLAFVTMESALPHLHTGRIRALGVTQARRAPAYPDVPAIAESVPGFEMNGFFGFVAPAGTAPAVVHRLYKGIAKVLRSPGVSARLNDLATVVEAAGPEQFAAFLQREVTKYRTLAQRTGITVD